MLCIAGRKQTKNDPEQIAFSISDDCSSGKPFGLCGFVRSNGIPSLAELPSESAMFCQISGASYGYLKEFTLSDDGAKVCTIINPMVNGEPLIPEKTYRLAFCGSPSETENPEPVISTMEEAAAAMGEYLKSGKAVILPDVPIPDNRIVPMEEIPADAVIYQMKLEAENKEV